MSLSEVYERSWRLLESEIDERTSWGKEQLKRKMHEIKSQVMETILQEKETE